MNIMGMKISIITVSYNSAGTIEQTIQSVINQTYRNIEYIIIDGGSTDGTIDIVKKYGDKIAYCISEPDKGIYDAMNKGIRMSTGDVVGMINSDDWYADGTVETIANIFVTHKDIEIVYGDLNIIGDTVERIESLGKFSSDSELEWFWQPTVFIRKEIYEKYGCFDVSYLYEADVAYFLQLQIRKVKSMHISQIFSYFRLGGVSNNNCHQWKQSKETIRLLSEIKQKFILNKEETRIYNNASQNATKYHKELLLDYMSNRMKRYSYQSKFWRDLLLNCKKKGYIVWGAGHNGKKLLYANPVLRAFIRYYIDKEPEKYNFQIDGIPVCEFDIKKIDENLILIASTNYADEMQKKLTNMGFHCERDFYVYTGESLLLHMARYIIKQMK